MTEARRWYAARAKPAQEILAVKNLENQNFETYFPQITIERRKAFGNTWRIVRDAEPLFRGYVLIRFELSTARWQSINSTRGVHRLIGFGEFNVPVAIRAGEIERLKERDSKGELFISELQSVRRGDLVRFRYGFAVDRVGEVARTEGERVTVLLSLLGQQTKIVVPMHALDVVSRAVRKLSGGSAVAVATQQQQHRRHHHHRHSQFRYVAALAN